MGSVLDLFTEDWDWSDDAACKRTPLDWWFPERGQTDRPALTRCFRCPVRRQCLEASMTIPEGIFGGTHGVTRRTWRGTLDELYEHSRDDAELRGLTRKETHDA